MMLILVLMSCCIVVNGSLFKAEDVRCEKEFSKLKDDISLVNCPAGCKGKGDKNCGDQVYSGNSRICKAAIHAGQIGEEGGEVTVLRKPQAGNTEIQESNKNGVEVESCTISGTSYKFMQSTTVSKTFTSNKITTPECRIKDCYAGVKDERVGDQMTASSFYDHGGNRFPPGLGRLDGDSYWAPATIEPREWLQVDFLANKRIYGVVTQGGRWESDGKPEGWATKFEIKYGNDSATLDFIREGSSVKVFDGNVDWNNHKINWFPRPVTARYFRLVVVSSDGTRLRLRLEYLTC